MTSAFPANAAALFEIYQLPSYRAFTRAGALRSNIGALSFCIDGMWKRLIKTKSFDVTSECYAGLNVTPRPPSKLFFL